MKIVVDNMPESVEKCMFSERRQSRDGHSFYACGIATYQPVLGHKAKCVCKSVSKCNVLMTLGGMNNENQVSE